MALMLVPTKIIPLIQEIRQGMEKLVIAILLTFTGVFCILVKALSENVFIKSTFLTQTK